MAIVEEDVPVLETGEVLVKTAVSGISAGTEMLAFRGQLPPELSLDATIDSLSSEIKYPFKYGYCAVGKVVELGKEVDTSWLNRTVFSFNPHESHFAANVAGLIPLPKELDDETAVLLPNMETAVSFLMDSQPMIGERVVVFGQGVVGLLTTFLLAQFPLASLMTVDSIPARQKLSKQWGATAVIDPTSPDAIAQIKALGKADLVLELSGNPKALDTAIEVVGYNGRILIGSWYGQKRADLNLGSHFHRNHIKLISSQVSTMNPQWRGRWTKERRMETAVHQLQKLTTTTNLITHRTPISQASQIYQQLDQSPQKIIQSILTY